MGSINSLILPPPQIPLLNIYLVKKMNNHIRCERTAGTRPEAGSSWCRTPCCIVVSSAEGSVELEVSELGEGCGRERTGQSSGLRCQMLSKRGWGSDPG